MENKKAQGGSVSSFTSLFGSQQSSSSDVFGSIFPPPKGVGQNFGSEGRGSWPVNQPCHTRQDHLTDRRSDPRIGLADNSYKHRDASLGSKEKNSIYQQEGAEPYYMSSSLYYGGQETYSKSTAQSTSSSYHIFKKDGGEDVPSISARGDWWQGSLYY